MATCTKLYVEEQLEQHFKEMIHYVKFAEAAAAKAKGPVEGRPIPGYGPAEAAPIVKAFAARWTSAIEAMNKFDPSPCVAFSNLEPHPCT